MLQKVEGPWQPQAQDFLTGGPVGQPSAGGQLLGLPRGSEVGDAPGGQWSSEAQERPASTAQERLCASFQVPEIPNAIACPHPPWHGVTPKLPVNWGTMTRSVSGVLMGSDDDAMLRQGCS